MNKVIRLIFIVMMCSFSTIVAQNNSFNRLMRYDIKGIAVNETFICDLNGFNHGKIDYGIYKERGFYFAIFHDNAQLGENVIIFESTNHSTLTTNEGLKIIQYDLIQLDDNSERCKAKFWEDNDVVYFLLIYQMNGEEVGMLYVLLPQ